MKRALLMLLSINIMGFAVYFFLTFTPYSYFGSYKGWPIYIQSPPLWMLIVYLVLISISILTFFSSVDTNKRISKISQLLALLSIVSLIICMGFIYMPSFKIVYSLVGGYSDSYIIQVNAARSLLKLENPYLSSYIQDLIIKYSYPDYTFIFKNGPPFKVNDIIGFVSSYDYLAFAMIYYIPKVVLNIPKSVYDSIVYAISLYLVYRKIKEPYKSLFPFILASALFIYIGEPIAFSPIVGWIALTMVAVAYSDHPFISGVLFGLAISYRETAGVFLIFYLIYAYFQRLNVKKILKGLIISSLIINLPFLILSPTEFIKSVLLPIDNRLMPVGAGLSTLYLYGIYLPKEVYTGLFLLTILIGIAIYIRYYQKLKYAGLIIPSISFLFYYRPLPLYYMWFPLMALIAYSVNIKQQNNINIKGFLNMNWITITYELIISSLLVLLISYITSISHLLLIIGLIGLAIISLNVYIIGINNYERKYNPKNITYIILGLLIIFGILASKFTPTLSLFVTSKALQTSQELVVESSALNLIKLHNPYNYNYYYPILKNTSFGYLSESIPYNFTPINISKVDPIKQFSMYYNNTNNKWYNLTVLDFLPGITLLYSPAYYFSLSPHAYASLIYGLSLGLLGFVLYKDNKLDLLLITILEGFFVPILYFSTNIIPTIVISFIIISIILIRYNLLASGVIYALSVLTYPQMLLTIPFFAIFVYNFKKSEFKKFLISFLTTFTIIMLLFSSTSKNAIYYSLIPILHYIKGNINLGLLFNLNPLYLSIVGIVVLIFLSIYYFKNFSKIKEFGLLGPLFISLLLPSLSIQLITIFIMIPLISHFVLK